MMKYDSDNSTNIKLTLKNILGIKILYPHNRDDFLLRFRNKKNITLLDVGCGNSSVCGIKRVCPNVNYIGLDVGDYNQVPGAIKMMDKYIVVSPEEFASEIGKLENQVDIVISKHNLEHCNQPEMTLVNMLKALKNNGKIYLAFPSEKSVDFPSRKGTLNFYDDPTHVYLPRYDEVLSILEKNGVKIRYAKRQYRPLVLRLVGRLNVNKCQKSEKVFPGIWEYYGFETIIWGEKQGK